MKYLAASSCSRPAIYTKLLIITSSCAWLAVRTALERIRACPYPLPGNSLKPLHLALALKHSWSLWLFRLALGVQYPRKIWPLTIISCARLAVSMKHLAVTSCVWRTISMDHLAVTCTSVASTYSWYIFNRRCILRSPLNINIRFVRYILLLALGSQYPWKNWSSIVTSCPWLTMSTNNLTSDSQTLQ